MSQQEKWVCEKEKDFKEEKRFLGQIGNIELTWLEAVVLLQVIYRQLQAYEVADLLNKTIGEVETAEDTLVRKTAVALGYITEKQAGVKLRRVEDELARRRRRAAELYAQEYSTYRISKELGVSAQTVSNDLKALGIKPRQKGWKVKR